MKRIMNDASEDMGEFVLRMEAELPSYKLHLSKGVETFARAVPIYFELDENKVELKANLAMLLESMDKMLESMQSFRDSVHGLPRATTSLVKSRKSTERVLQDVIDVTTGAKASLEGALSLLP